MMKVGDGQTFVYQSYWSDNQSYNNNLGGRVAIYRDSNRDNTAFIESVFVASSQEYGSARNLGSKYVDLIKLTFTNDV